MAEEPGRISTDGRRRRAKRGDGGRLREELLAAAEALLDDAGEDAVTIRAVAQAVGVTTPAVYLHFENRSALLHTVCLGVWDELDREMSGAGDGDGDGTADPLAALVRRGSAYIRFGLAHPLRYRLVASGPATAATRQVADACFRFLRDTVGRCVDAGVLDGDVNALTRAVCACLHGAVSLLILQPESAWPDDIARYADDVATVAARGAAALSGTARQ
ncbi:TetR/AcrR family transcriptional regulator [Streptomyces sp. NPDC051976]|uniref:TetR/AcrR family transcriptional regulator n=1 Tax=Streptomyces sp. NPDC051976 TaxID=3154947 RepID=UPI003439FFD1